MERSGFKYYLNSNGDWHRLFSLGMNKEGTIIVQRRFPQKDAHLSRKRGVKYLETKEKFMPTWKEDLEYLGCMTLSTKELAPCTKEQADSQRTFILPSKHETLMVHLVMVKAGHEKEFPSYLPPSVGESIGRRIEKELHPNIGIILTSA